MAKKRGKVLTTFSYTKHGMNLDVAIRLIERHQVNGEFGSDPHELWYLIDLDKPRVICNGPDIEAVRKEAIKKLDAVCGVTWERKILLTIARTEQRPRSTGYDAGERVELSFDFKYLDVGTNTLGEQCYSECSWAFQQSGDEEDHLDDGSIKEECWVLKRSGYIHRNSPMQYPRDGEQTALIDYNAENIAKVAAIIKGMNTLAARMQELFTEKNLAHTMANIQLLGLPAPAATTKKKAK